MSLLPQGPKGPAMPGVPTQGGIDRRKQIAEALMRVGQQGTGLSGPWGTIAAALTGGIAGYQQRKAGNEQTALDDDKKRKMAEALAGVTGTKIDPAALSALPLEQQQALYTKVMADRLTPKQAEGFTLSPGQGRFGPDGKPIATLEAKQDPFTLSPGQSRFGPDGKPIAAVDPELARVDQGGMIGMINPLTGVPVSSLPKTVSPDAQLSSATTRRGQDISSTTTQRGQDISAATAAAGQGVTARGQDIGAESARLAAGNKPLSEYQSKGISQLTRMQGAEQELSSLQQQGFSPGYVNKVSERVLGNMGATAESQRYKQAASEFIAGILRLDSGAAVPEVEFERYFQTYFAQPGDSEEVIQQKSASRLRAMDALRTGIGQKASDLVPQPGASGGEPAQLASAAGLPQVPQVEAPPAAIEALKANPQLAEQFKAKFGYLPPL